MDKILHTGWVKWLAGLLMMLVFSIGIYFGIRVVAAVESGGLEILNGNVPSSYEQSRHCAGDLAELLQRALYYEMQEQNYKDNYENTNKTAMTVMDYAQWLGTLATETALAKEGAPEEDPEKYTYDYLLSLRNTNKVTEDSAVDSEFFYDDNTGMNKPAEYVRVNQNELIAQIMANAENKYILDDVGDMIGSEEEWMDTSEQANREKTLYQYEADVNGDTWYYNEYTKVLYCGRFGQVKQNALIYYHKTDLDKYANGLLEEGRQDAGAALLAAPMCYLDGLIEYYTRNFVLYKDQKEQLDSMGSDYVNYRYQIELQDGTICTNMEKTDDITKDASVYWSYDRDSGEMSGNMTAENKEYFYDVLTTYHYAVEDYYGKHVNPGIYLQDKVKHISVALADDMTHYDEMRENKKVYENYAYLYQNARKYMFYTIIMGILGLVLFVYLLLVVGYQNREGTLTKAPLSFRIPTELLLLLVFLLCVVLCVMADSGNYFMIRVTGGELNFISLIVIGMLWSVLPIAFEMLSRIRHRQLLARSICYRVIRYVFGKPVCWLIEKFGNIKDGMKDVVQAVKVDTRLCTIFAASQAGLAFLLLLSIVFLADGQGGVGMFFLFLVIVLEVLVCLVVFRDIRYTAEIIQGVQELENGNLDYQIPTEHMKGHKKELAENINHLQNGLKVAVEQSIKDERLKTELITNVSHDIKTPLTSIINYVDLLKKEPITAETALHYIEVLDQKSQRLKQLMEDLVEVSKSATGNVDFNPMRLDLIEMLRQILGEFEDKFVSRNLEVIENFKIEVAIVNLDSRHTFRVFENLCQNIFKYAMENSRVYVDVFGEQDKVYVVMKNISQYALNISADELMERFVRGDESRNTSGSGLGLSITKNLVTLQQGEFHILLDGDLFKATVMFPLAVDATAKNEEPEK